VVEFKTGVVKFIPVARILPPLEAAYQLNVPPPHPEALI
jgi:hypothetical protein